MKVHSGERIYRERRKNGWTQGQLAGLIGRSQQYISLLENGEELTCSEETADRICRYLGVDLEDIFAYPPPSRTPKDASSKRDTSDAAKRPRGSVHPPVRRRPRSAA